MNTVYSQEEIIESLKVIKETCQKASSCKECPLCIPNSDTNCYIMSTVPGEWEIVEPAKHIWRAFQ